MARECRLYKGDTTMGYEFINKLPTPAEIKEQFPLPVECVAAKAQRDEEVKKAISG